MSTTDEASNASEPNGLFFWVMFIIGGAAAGFGIWSLLTNAAETKPVYSAVLAFALNVAHDALVAPVIVAIGLVITRVVPALFRWPVRFGFISSAAVIAVGYIPWTGYGIRPDNPSLLPLDYTTAILTVLGVVWAIAGFWAAANLIRSARTP